jgi:hypothetical protein
VSEEDADVFAACLMIAIAAKILHTILWIMVQSGSVQ